LAQLRNSWRNPWPEKRRGNRLNTSAPAFPGTSKIAKRHPIGHRRVVLAVLIQSGRLGPFFIEIAV
jgi:hypothetical protein